MEIFMNVTAFSGALLIRLLGHTWRIRFPEKRLEEMREAYGPIIYAFWHGRLLPLSFTHRDRRVQVLASIHRDGELMGRTIRFLGFGHVRGSSTRGGTRAILELARKIEEGFDLGITVDGPKGPRFVAKPGPLEIAKLTGAPVVPITTSSRSHWTFSSWDEFQLPKPFTEVFVDHGEPIFVPRKAGPEEVEEARLALQRALLDLTEKGDARAGHR